MIDIHSHILPKLDDGAANVEVSLGLLKLAVAAGTTEIIATPHVLSNTERPEWATIKQNVAMLQELAANEGLAIKIHAGAELELNWEMFELLEAESAAYCLAGSRYVLLELPSQTIPTYTEEFFYKLQLLGKQAIIAHPERHPKLMRHPSILAEWIKNGVLTQCNAGSFSGLFGSAVQGFVEQLLQRNMVYFLGSDAHRLEGRNTDMRVAQALWEKNSATEKLKEIMEINPRFILEDKYLATQTPLAEQSPKGGRSFWSKLFGRS